MGATSIVREAARQRLIPVSVGNRRDGVRRRVPVGAPRYHPPMSNDALALLAGLFASAFLSATVLPGSSEIALAALVAHVPALALAAVLVATVGNTLGGMTSYAIGRLLPAPPRDNRALALVRRYGAWALLFSWLPVVGDALCIASGWLRQHVLPAACAIAAGKLARYLVVAEGVRRLAA